MNLYSYNPEISCQNLIIDQNYNNPLQNYNYNDQLTLISSQIQPLDECQTVPHNLGYLGFDPLEPTEVPDIPDTCFNYISDLLREEFISDDQIHTSNNVTLQDYMDAQLSYNKSLDAAINFGQSSSPFTPNNNNSSSSNNNHNNNSHNNNNNHDYRPVNVLCQSSRHCLDDYINMFSTNCSNVTFPDFGVNNQNIVQNNFVQSNISGNPRIVGSNFGSNLVSNLDLVESCNGVGSTVVPTPLNLILGRTESDHLGNSDFALVMNSTPNVQQGGMDLYVNDNRFLQDSIVHSLAMVGNSENLEVCGNGGDYGDNSRRRKHGSEENEGENDDTNERSNKINAISNNNDVIEQIEEYGDVILCPEGRSKPGALCNNLCKSHSVEDSPKGSKKKGHKGQIVDLRGLLTRCAQCVAQVNLIGAYEMLKQIREYSSPHGDFLQRVAHYLANGLKARLEGKGLELTRASEEISPSEVLKANRVFVASVPYQIMSYYTMNKTIATLVEEAPSIHIIDFGIYYGLQWPCIIQNLSKRPNGPPKIRITGIDFPQRGFRPSERIEETGRCLGKYCEKYNVPFEYHPIAKKWEDVQLDELMIERNEPLVVNCLYRSHQLFDESVEENSPRDAFLKLVRKINPDMFMHAVLNSTSNVPFFLNRFKEAMFHYSALFDIFESTMNREDNERMLLESKVYGPQALNIIACEGMERVIRPESYKQWQVRTQRAGFKQVGLDQGLLRRARAMVKRSFREEFSYDEDGYWVVQGWKGRILYAISCWKPS